MGIRREKDDLPGPTDRERRRVQTSPLTSPLLLNTTVLLICLLRLPKSKDEQTMLAFNVMKLACVGAYG